MITVAKRVKNIQASGIRKVFSLAGQIKNPANFSLGQPDFDVPSTVKKAAIEAINAGFNKYTPTEGLPELREKIAVKIWRENQIAARPEEILVTTGVSGGLFLTFATLLAPGDEIIIPDPYFVIYKEIPEFLGVKIKLVDTYPDFRLPLVKMEKMISPKTKALLLNSPNNPTGVVYSREEVEGVVKLAQKHKLFIISDEIYEAFVYDGSKNFSPASLYKKTVTLNGFSKTAGIPGWRIGYLHTSKEVVEEMAKLQQYTFVCAPSFAQVAALKALDLGTDKIKTNYQAKRNIIYKGLKEHFELVRPQGAFYVFPKIPAGQEKTFVTRAANQGVLVIPGDVFSQKDTHFRLSFATNENTLRRGVKILQGLAKKIPLTDNFLTAKSIK